MKKNSVWGRLLSRVLISVICLSLAVGCGSENLYSGIEIGNPEEISEVIRGCMLDRSYRVNITFRARTLNRERIAEMMDALYHGALYESDDPKGGDYLRYQCGGYTLTHSVERKWFRYTYTSQVVPKYYTTAEQEAFVDEAVTEVIAGFHLQKDAPDYEKVRCVRDYICDTVEYDTVHRHLTGSSHIQSTAYAALAYHTALCQGYAVLAYRLLKELGVETRIVTGTADVAGSPERHAWNIVRIGDVFYNLDITMDDVTGSFRYFLKTDETFSADHARDEEFLTEVFVSEYPMASEEKFFEQTPEYSMVSEEIGVKQAPEYPMASEEIKIE